MIQKDEVELLPFEREYCNHILLWNNSMPSDRPLPFSKNKLSAEALIGLSEDSRSLLYIVCLDKKNIIGFVRIFDIDMYTRRANTYVFIDPKIKNFSTLEYKTNILLSDYCFSTLGLNRISVDVFYGNVYLLKLYDKIGFKRDILKRQHYFSGGSYQHVVEMSLLASDGGSKNGN